MTLESLDIKQQKLQQLQQILPEIFEDGEIIPDKLKDVFVDEVNESREHYSFTWAGKRDCYKTIREKTNATLKVDEDKTIPNGENVFIEGDNLEVLKLLQLSYHKKVKMIYIDPPYNKDKDFVYSDTWGDTIQNYLIQTDQLREEGYTTTKTNSTGRRHTNWLNMIYPRLWLSRNLLKDDGVIFVSIDDDEVHNLRKLMDEIYGEENFITSFIWEKRTTRENRRVFSVNHDYILCYAKSKENFEKIRNLLPLTEEAKSRYSNPDNDSRGLWQSVSLNAQAGHATKSQFYTIVTPAKKEVNPPSGRCWSVTNEVYEKLLNDNRIWFGKDGNNVPRQKVFLNEIEQGLTPHTLWKANEVGTTDSAKKELLKLFEGQETLDTPKSVLLIQRLIQISTNDDDIILDFFAGSGTTAQAVMALNQEDEGNRKYILVQLPEATDEKSEAYKAGYKIISDITKERIKRAMKKLDYKEGFKSFYLDNSNFQVFKEVKKRPDMSYEEIEKMLKMSMFDENILTQGAKELDIVYEVGLKNGFTLSAELEEIKTDKYSFITLSEDERVFYFSFDKKIEGDIVHDVPKDAKLICYEKALTTNVKLNLRENLDLEVL